MPSGINCGQAACLILLMPSNSSHSYFSSNSSMSASRTPNARPARHIIRMTVRMLSPRPGGRVCDPAAGTCGFLVNAWQHLLESHTDPRDLTFDDEGWPHGLTGSRLKREDWNFAQTQGFTGFD